MLQEQPLRYDNEIFPQPTAEGMNQLLKTWRMFVIVVSVVLSACAVHKIDVQQGNAVAPEKIAQLKAGMTKRQVIFIMGTPLLVDPFHNSRWDYIYSLESKGKMRERRHLALFFDGDELVRISGDPGTIGVRDKPGRPVSDRD